MNTHEEQLLNAIVKQALENVELKDEIEKLKKELIQEKASVDSWKWSANQLERDMKSLKEQAEGKKEKV